tara:strand:+ start:164 stop:1864 length:1701 start_codon:yes stop_codon:yes gene_type:complete
MIRWLSLGVCLGIGCVQMPELRHCEDDVPCPEPEQVCHDGWCLDPTPSGGTRRPDSGSEISDTGSLTDASRSLDTGVQGGIDAGMPLADTGSPSTDTGAPLPEACSSPDFNGSSAYLSLSETEDNPFGLTKNLSLSVWVKVPNHNGTTSRWIFDLENHLGVTENNVVVGFGAALGLRDTGHVSFGVFDGIQTWDTQTVFSEDPIAVQRWVHVIAVRFNTRIEIYVDGVLQGAESVRSRNIGFKAQSNNNYDLGRHGQPIEASHQFFTGQMSRVNIWNRALSAEEIPWVHGDVLNDSLSSGLVGRWLLNEGHGSDVSDALLAHNGQLRGGATWVDDCPEPPAPAAPRDCQEIIANDRGATSGIYVIDPDGLGPEEAYDAYCEMDIEEGGWTRAVSVQVNSALWNAGTARWQWVHAEDPSGTFGLGFDRFSDGESGEDLDYLFATFDGQTETFHGPLFRGVHLNAWHNTFGPGSFDDSFEYRMRRNGARWQRCDNAALNHALVRHNWSISGNPDQDCSSSVGTMDGTGFLLSGIAGSEEIGAKLSGLGHFNGNDQFHFLRIYTRRSQD